MIWTTSLSKERVQTIRAIATQLRDRDGPNTVGWSEIARNLNTLGHKTQKGTPWRPLTVYRLVGRTEAAVAAPRAPATVFTLEMVRAAARSKTGTAEERLQFVQAYLG